MNLVFREVAIRVVGELAVFLRQTALMAVPENSSVRKPPSSGKSTKREQSDHRPTLQ